MSNITKLRQLINWLSLGKAFFNHFLTKGKSAETGTTEANVDPEQLRMGIEVEFEHTDDSEIAKKIALDHLAEIPDYYTRLKKMEEEAGVED